MLTDRNGSVDPIGPGPARGASPAYQNSWLWRFLSYTGAKKAPERGELSDRCDHQYPVSSKQWDAGPWHLAQLVERQFPKLNVVGSKGMRMGHRRFSHHHVR